MKSPFKFLDSYTRADKDIFFGRDRETEALYQKVFESKILLLYGVSGTGKSSLIDCGLGNKIADSDWLPVSVRRGSGIVESLGKQLEHYDSQVKSKKEKVKSGGSSKEIIRILKSVYLDHFKPIYLIFDQFEELFIFGSKAEREEFIDIVKAIMDADVQCKMLFSIREEYLANITEFERKVPGIMQNRMRVEKMSRSHAMEVIEGPCRVHGIELEEGFAEALMSKLVPEGNEVELTYLQVYLDKVFKEASGVRTQAPGGTKSQDISFMLADLEKLGNVSDLLGSFLEDQIVQLEDPESGLAVLKSFVSLRGTKRQITHEEVLESCKTLGTVVEDETLKELINKFVDLRILRDKDENGRYELRHDSLAAKIFEKITLVEKEVMEVRLFIENAFSAFQTRNTLLSDDDLKYIEPYEDRLFLVRELQAFVDKSKYDFEAKRRSFKRTISISIVGFILIIAAGWYYFYQQTQDKEMKDLAINAMMQTDYSPELGLISAMSAYREDSTQTLAKKVLLDAFYTKLNAEPEVQKELFDFVPVDYPILSIDLSADGQYIYGWMENNQVKIWDLFGKEILTINTPGKAIQRLRLSDNMEYMGIFLEDSIIAVHSLLDSTVFSVPTTPNGVNDKYLFDFSNRQEYVIAVANDDKVVLYDKNGKVFQELTGHDSIVNAIDISPDHRFLASASSDAKINVWYFNTKLKQYSFYNSIGKPSKAGVRTCQFNQNSDYILTASDDSITRIRKLDGGQNGSLDRYDIAPGYHYYMEYKLVKAIQGRECDAYFVHGEQMIVIRVREDEINPDSLINRTNLYLVHYRTSEFRNSSGDIFKKGTVEFLNDIAYEDPCRYDFLVPAPDTRTIATVKENGNEVNIVASEHLPILLFMGTNPVYTFDSKYIISIQDKVLQKHIVDPGEIIQLISEKKIFGELEYEVRDWLSY